MRVGNHDSVFVEAGFQDLVRDIALDFPADVHDVQTEDYERGINLVGVQVLE